MATRLVDHFLMVMALTFACLIPCGVLNIHLHNSVSCCDNYVANSVYLLNMNILIGIS